MTVADACPYLDYREEDPNGDRSFDTPRAYCEAAESFVQPMRADICNLRYGLDPAEDCEIFIEAEGEEAGENARTDADGDDADARASSGDGTDADAGGDGA